MYVGYSCTVQEGFVVGMTEKLPQKPALFEPAWTSKFTRRSCLHVHIVIVKVAGPPLDIGAASCFLVIDVGHILLSEGAVVKPIVAHPAIDHRVHRHRNL